MFGENEIAIEAIAGGTTRLALVDDDDGVRGSVERALASEGFLVSTYASGAEALASWEARRPQLALVDLVMPGMDGMDVVRRARMRWSFPIIMLTARNDELDEVMCLRMGADDYVRKPFSHRTLTARIAAILRRGTAPEEAGAREAGVEDPAGVLARGALRMDPRRHRVSWNGRDVALTVTEYHLLEALARRPGFVKSRDQLMDEAYDDQVFVDDRTIDSHIKRLRKKMRAIDPEFTAIETLYGIGYRYSDAHVG